MRNPARAGAFCDRLPVSTATSDDELDAFFAELAAWPDPTGCRVSSHHYGDHPDQRADLVLPAGGPPHPVAVVLHGGFWRGTYGSEIMRAVAASLAGVGWAAWNVEYRRVGGGGGYPATLDDVSAACAAIGGVEEPLDTSRVVAVGHSAGGHLALWLAGRRRVTAAVSLAGICDLQAGAKLGNGAAQDFMGDATPDGWRDADPIQALPTGVPTVLVHGRNDDVVPVAQSRAYHRGARTAGDDCTLLEADCGHFEPIDPRSPVWASILEELARFA